MRAENLNWFVLIGSQKYGPYTYRKMIELIQTNQLMDYNYAWNECLDNWTPLYQLEDFSADRFQLILNEQADLSQAFKKRVSPRLSKQLPLLGHNTIRFFDGEVVSISESGALCMLNSPLLQVGDSIKIHIKASESVDEAFNIEGTIIRKNFSRKRLNTKSGLFYAARFTQIQPKGLVQIQRWLNQAS